MLYKRTVTRDDKKMILLLPQCRCAPHERCGYRGGICHVCHDAILQVDEPPHTESVICLRCDKEFDSVDKRTNRICPTCNILPEPRTGRMVKAVEFRR